MITPDDLEFSTAAANVPRATKLICRLLLESSVVISDADLANATPGNDVRAAVVRDMKRRTMNRIYGELATAISITRRNAITAASEVGSTAAAQAVHDAFRPLVELLRVED